MSFPTNPPERSWFVRAARKIVREGKSFTQAIDELKIDGLKPAEMDKVFHSDVFQMALRQERLRLANEIANDPNLSKNSAIGMMVLAIEKLMAKAEWDKALEGLQKLAKLAGWQGADGQVTVFADLKGKDIENLRREIEQRSRTGSTEKTFNA